MACTVYEGAIVCGPPRGIYHRLTDFTCWTCEVETRMVQTWDGAYYGTTLYCLECGDVWADGYRYERPFARYWKRDRIQAATKMWDNALSDEAWQAYSHADVQWACARTKKDDAKARAALNRANRLIAKERAA